MRSIYFLLKTIFFILHFSHYKHLPMPRKQCCSRKHILSPRSGSLQDQYLQFNNHHPLQLADMLEPLREIRDGYLISLSFGTPSPVIQVYRDTGSDLTWLPCTNHSPFDCIDAMKTRITLFLRIIYCLVLHTHHLPPCDSCSSPYCIHMHISDNLYDPC